MSSSANLKVDSQQVKSLVSDAVNSGSVPISSLNQNAVLSGSSPRFSPVSQPSFSQSRSSSPPKTFTPGATPSLADLRQRAANSSVRGTPLTLPGRTTGSVRSPVSSTATPASSFTAPSSNGSVTPLVSPKTFSPPNSFRAPMGSPSPLTTAPMGSPSPLTTASVSASPLGAASVGRSPLATASVGASPLVAGNAAAGFPLAAGSPLARSPALAAADIARSVSVPNSVGTSVSGLPRSPVPSQTPLPPLPGTPYPGIIGYPSIPVSSPSPSLLNSGSSFIPSGSSSSPALREKIAQYQALRNTPAATPPASVPSFKVTTPPVPVSGSVPRRTPLSEILNQRRSARLTPSGSPGQENVEKVFIEDLPTAVENDPNSIVDVAPIVASRSYGSPATLSPMDNYKNQLKAIGVTVIGVINFNDSKNMMILSVVSNKGIKFYVRVNTYTNASLYITDSRLVLSSFSSAHSNIEDKISIEECAASSVCDILYTCNDEACYLNKEKNGFSKSLFNISYPEGSDKVGHEEGTLIGRPIVTYEELIGDPVNTLSYVESSSINLLKNALDNANTESRNVIRKMVAATYDTVQIQNLYLNVISAISDESTVLGNQLSVLDINSEDAKLTVDRLNQVNYASEEVLNILEHFNESIKALNLLSLQLNKTINEMHTAVDTLFPEGNQFRDPALWEDLRKGDQAVASGQPLDLNVIVS